jgi:hypothetical protein
MVTMAFLQRMFAVSVARRRYNHDVLDFLFTYLTYSIVLRTVQRSQNLRKATFAGGVNRLTTSYGIARPKTKLVIQEAENPLLVMFVGRVLVKRI